MKLFIKKITRLEREEVLMLLAIFFASLVGLLGTAVFLSWTESFNPIVVAGIRPFLISLAATLIYCAGMGAVVYLIHPRKGLLQSIVGKR